MSVTVDHVEYWSSLMSELGHPDLSERGLAIPRVAELSDFTGTADGGYVSFLYGVKDDYGGWDYAKSNFSTLLVIMDRAPTSRTSHFPEYKQKRKTRRKEDPSRVLKYQQVRSLRNHMEEDIEVHTTYLDRYEADDVLALLAIKGIGGGKVVGRDKDFAQVESMELIDIKGKPSIPNMRLPKYAKTPTTPQAYLLTQCLFGDKSDSIPRLMSSNGHRAKHEYAKHVRRPGSFSEIIQSCLSSYGGSFVQNIKLLLLPHYTLSNCTDIDDILDKVVDGSYWTPDNFSDDHVANIYNNYISNRS